MNRIPGMTQQLAGVAVPGQSQTYNQYAISGQVQQPQTYNPYNPAPGWAVPAMAQPGFNSSVAPNPYAPAASYTPGVLPYAPQPTVAQPVYSPYIPAPQIPGVGIPQHQSAAPTTPQVPGVTTSYNPYAAPVQPTYNPYAPAAAPQPQAYNPYAPAAIPGMAPGSIPGAPGYRPNPGIIGAPQIPEVQPTYNPAVAPNPYAPTAPVQPQAYNPYTTVQPQSDYSQNVILSESEHIYNFLYSSSKTRKEIVDYIKERDPSYSSQESGGITTYLTIFGIYFVCDNAITNPNFLEAVLKSALIRNYRILDNGYVAFISEIATSCTESITKDSIISFAIYLCEKNYLLTLRKEQFIFTNSGNLIFIDFSSLIPKEYMMGLEKYLYSPSGVVLYQEPSLLFNNVDCLFIDIFKKKYFKRNEIIEIEKRITNFNQLKRSVYR